MATTIDWSQIYRRFSAPVTRIDCGALCAAKNKGVPVCCANSRHVPVLFTDELRWHTRAKTGMWRERPVRSKLDKKQADEILDYLKYCLCPGIKECQRGLRSLTCRFFPFEPYIDEDGEFVGITYMYRAGKDCPLIDNDAIKVNKAYVRQAMDVWATVFDLYPQELELYHDESRKLQRKFRKLNRVIKVFAVKGAGAPIPLSSR
jgi:hypothetical protein